MKESKILKGCATSVVLFIAMGISPSCTDAKWAKVGGLGDEFTIEMVNCDGSVARTWISTGKVSSEANSDGYYFMEKGTNKLIEVTGRVVITKN
jgi:hypothetical protein